MQCNNKDCPASYEPETPCWKIAKMEGTFQYVSNTCRDCIVYVLKKETENLTPKEIEKMITQRGFPGKLEAALLDCFLNSTIKK